jgi:hypothetical protein
MGKRKMHREKEELLLFSSIVLAMTSAPTFLLYFVFPFCPNST